MILNLLKISLIFLGIILSGLGIYYYLLNRFDCKPSRARKILDIGLGFTVIYSVYCLIYFILIFSQIEEALKAAALSLKILIFIGSTLLLVKICIKTEYFKKISKYMQIDRITLLIISLTFVIVVIPQLILGNLPFIVSDSWSHISIINRLLDYQDLSLTSFSMPNDNYGLRYSPHHSFLSAIAYIANVKAIEVWIVARYFYPIILLTTFLYFIQIFDRNYNEKIKNTIIAIIFFGLLYVTTDGVWRGSADYRIASFILLFVLLSILYPIISGNNNLSIIAVFITVWLSFAIAVTHGIQIAILTLMIVPYGIYNAIKKKSKTLFIYSIAASLIFFISGIITLWISKTAFAPLNKNVEYVDFIGYYFNQLNVHIVIYTWLAAVLLVIFHRFIEIKLDSMQVEFFKTSLISSIILGPINPFLFPLYNELMGSSHSNRIMYVFPFYLILILYASKILNELTRPIHKRKKLHVTIFMVIVLAVIVNFYKKSGLDGKPTYRRSDNLSQLKIYPNFYQAINKHYSRKIVISDVFTSAPINVVTNNYIFTHRPWTGGVDDRFNIAKTIMNNPIREDSIGKICKFKIDLLVINENKPPSDFKKNFEAAPWLYSDFKLSVGLSKIITNNGFIYKGHWDGIHLFEIDRDLLCT